MLGVYLHFCRTRWWYDYNQQRWRTGLHDIIWDSGTDAPLINHYDGVLNYGFTDCSSAIIGIGGVHNNHHEDRKWWVRASVVKTDNRQLGDCVWTGYINDWDGGMDYQVGSNQYVSRVYSYHDNGKEDRRWKLCVCTARNV